MSTFLISVFTVILGMVLLTLLIGYFISRKSKSRVRSKSYSPPDLSESAAFGLQVQLTAYERLVLFVERSYPPYLAEKLYSPELSKGELFHLLVQQIADEFNHNISQQVYVSTQVWEHLREYKDRNIMYLNLLYQHDPEEDCKAFVNNIINFGNEKAQRSHYLLLLDALRFELRAGVLKV